MFGMFGLNNGQIAIIVVVLAIIIFFVINSLSVKKIAMGISV
jgi:hypothetical protein